MLSASVLWILVYIQIFQGLSSEQKCLCLNISRSFNCPKCSPVVCLICYYLRSVRQFFCIARIHFKGSHTRQLLLLLLYTIFIQRISNKNYTKRFTSLKDSKIHSRKIIHELKQYQIEKHIQKSSIVNHVTHLHQCVKGRYLIL